ncbi:hypothetical protein ATK74_1918 [Propionicimonas paludicola]|uniref:Leucine rich repeat (LRR) protein n=1 Tax=Propionicimonas paludicola TaxID=185243 RepID=A0A2A9CT62_9ACTN|nr:hypothetical protein ATK74_1918 [Propionicimonas paludicola]
MNQPFARKVNGNARENGQRRPLRAGIVALLSVVLTAGLSVAAPTAAQAASVQFADAKLATCVAQHLSLDPGTTSFDSSDLAAITSLDCKDKGIADLTGIEALTGLTSLDISGNKVTDLAALEQIDSLPLSGLAASGQEVDWRIKVGTYNDLPINPWFDGDVFGAKWTKGLTRKVPWLFKADKAGQYAIIAGAQDYDFDIYFTVTAYTIKSFSAPTPKITGTVAVGKTLTAKPGTWKPSTAVLSYQWFRSGKAISGATAQTYTLTKSDLGKKMTVKVTGKQNEYKTATVTSKATGKVKAGTIVAGKVTLNGKAQVGQVMTVATSAADWSPNSVALSYQWYRAGKAVKGAKSASYTLTAADVKKKVSVKVSGALGGYTTRVITLNAGVIAGL